MSKNIIFKNYLSVYLFVLTMALTIIANVSYGTGNMYVAYPDGASVGLGDGFNIYTQDATQSPFANTGGGSVPPNSGQDVTLEAYLITSSREYNAAMQSSMAGSYKGFSMRVGGEASYSYSYSVSTQNVYVLVTTRVTNAAQRIQNVALSQAAKDLLGRTNGLEIFHQTFGQKYVRAIQSGGNFMGTLIFNCEDRAQKNEVMSAFYGKGITPYGTFSMDAQFQAAINEASKYASVTIKIDVKGYSSTEEYNLNLQTFEDFMEFAGNFPSIVASSPRAITFEVADYTDIPDYQLLKYGSYPNGELTPTEMTAFDNYLNDLIGYEYILQDLMYITLYPKYFYFRTPFLYSLTEVQQKRNEVQSCVDQMEMVASNFSGDISTLTIPLNMSSAVYEESIRNKLPIRWENWLEPAQMSVSLYQKDIGRLDIYNHIAGDSEGDGHDMKITMKADLIKRLGSTNDQELYANVTCNLRENQSDWTEYSGSKAFLVHNVPHGFVIKTMGPYTHGEINALDTYAEKHTLRWFAGTNLLIGANFLTDTDGGEDNELYANNITLHQIDLAYQHYEETLTDAEIGQLLGSVQIPRSIPIDIDIYPGSCPNPLQKRGKEVLPVAILGTKAHDVHKVVLGTINLLGVSPRLYSYEDVATPYTGEFTGDCKDCTNEKKDGYIDLVLEFDKQAVVEALTTWAAEAGVTLNNQDCVTLYLEAEALLDRTLVLPLIGQDVVRFQSNVVKLGK